MMYADGVGSADFDTATAVTVQDASNTDLAFDNTDGALVQNGAVWERPFTYAYGTNTQAGLSAGVDKDVVMEVGGIDKSKRRIVTGTITDSGSIIFDCTTDQETN